MRRLTVTALSAGFALMMVGSSGAWANELMPDFATVPTGWFTDRYNPDTFANVGTVGGRSDVLGIGIGAAGAYGNRPAAYQSQFYDTQGMGYSITGGAGDSLSAGLYIPSSWLTPSNGLVRTDMWGVMNDGTFNNVTDYPIIGFTNDGASGYVGLQVWDDTLNGGSGGWVELGTPFNSNGWNDLSITFTGTSFDYSVNGSTVYVQTNPFGSVDFQEVIMEAYNFDDSVNFPGVNSTPYTANWSNTPANVPEPSSLLMMVMGLGALAAIGICRKGSEAQPLDSIG